MISSQNKDKTFLYGTRATMECIHAGREIDKILVLKNLNNTLIQELLSLTRQHNIPVQRVPVQKLQHYTRKNHQGVVCLLSAIDYSSLDHVISQSFAEGRSPLVLVLDRITDVRNFGAIARTAECAGVDAIVIPGKGSAQITQEAIKTSAGALHFIPVCRVPSLNKCLKELKDSGLQVVACSEKARDLIYDVELSTPTALLMGSEENGIDPQLLMASDQHVKLPVSGKISSLNVSVATALVIYECLRQRREL